MGALAAFELTQLKVCLESPYNYMPISNALWYAMGLDTAGCHVCFK